MLQLGRHSYMYICQYAEKIFTTKKTMCNFGVISPKSNFYNHNARWLIFIRYAFSSCLHYSHMSVQVSFCHRLHDIYFIIDHIFWLVENRDNFTQVIDLSEKILFGSQFKYSNSNNNLIKVLFSYVK